MTGLLLLGGCEHYFVDFATRGRVIGEIPDTGSAPRAPDGGDAPPEEECNGVDDDQNGSIDEGFPDSDANGRADCLDASCPEIELAAGSTLVPLTESCPGEANVPPERVADPWRLAVQWETPTPGDSIVAPVIGNLDDDNGDGRIDGDDMPEVVFTTAAGHLLALDGATGTVKWRLAARTVGAMNPALGDVDNDGAPDIVVFDASGVPAVYRGDGTLLWRAGAGPWASGSGSAGIADLDADGAPEVLADNIVLEGATGALRFRLPTQSHAFVRSLAVADTDLDGAQELFYDGAAFDEGGNRLWDAPVGEAVTNWPVIVQADDDDEGEIIFVSDEVALYDTDGTSRWAIPLEGAPGTGPPCAGDFDGDGAMELVAATHLGGALAMFEMDGTVRWSLPLAEGALGGGCSGFDLNGDGALEVLYPGNAAFSVFDGRTGATLMSWSPYQNATAIRTAAVADIDRDGHAEIVLASSGGAPDAWVAALEHDGTGWPAAGPIWSNHSFAMTDVNTDGSIPQVPEPTWLRNKVYRSRTAVDGSLVAADLTVRMLDVCVADCASGPVRAIAEVTNQGWTETPAGLALQLFADDDGLARPIAEVTLPAVRPGEALPPFVFSLTPTDVGRTGFRVSVNGEAAAYECGFANNTDSWLDVFCP